MSLLSVRNLTFTHGGPPLLEGVSCEINRDERVGLIGRNGTGKTTLLKLLAGDLAPDDGEIQRDGNTTLAMLAQEVPRTTDMTVSQIIAEVVTPAIDDADHWQSEQKVNRILSRLKLNGRSRFATLSSGMKRRVMLARALVEQPDILLLDEPTNHLDIESITWLERFLRGYAGTLLFVTHDRTFLQQLATRIIEIERARLFDWSCGYDEFVERRRALLDAEDRQQVAFDRRLAREEVWIRRGIKARRTRNEGRVRALKRLREERRRHRERVGNVRLSAAEAERSGRMVIDVQDVSFAYGDDPVVRNLTTLITRGDRIGLIGPNGAGKTTLLNILLGNLRPDSGSVRHGTRLEVIYFDQLREQIDETQTVVELVGEGQEQLLIDGRRKHIYGYLQDFLFAPERARRPARQLSGGERNRLMLARLFKRPSNLMVLDEPTNDLDSETLELLEELLSDYKGTLLMVSHDRTFLNHVVTSTLAFDGSGVVSEYDGGYDDYLRQHKATAESAIEEKPSARKPKPKETAQPKPGRLSYSEQRELDSLPQMIEELETQQSELYNLMADPEFFKRSRSQIVESTSRLDALNRQLSELYARWQELDAR